MSDKKISYGRQSIDDDDIAAVASSLSSDFLTQGSVQGDFEAALGEYTGAKYAVVCSSGSAALHLAYMAAGLGEGDAIITTPNTFLATSNAAILSGARPFFSDIDPETLNLSLDLLQENIPRLLKNGKSVKAVVPVHFAGNPVDMERLSAIAEKYGLMVIEDACHALGAVYSGTNGSSVKVGSSRDSDMTVFSFHPVKSITTGEGGAITTNDADLYERLKWLRSHGVVREAGEFKYEDIASSSKTPPPWYHEMHELGLNYRLTDFQCALGLSQLKKLDGFIARRAEISELYDTLFRFSAPITPPPRLVRGSSAHHLYVIQIPFEEIGIDKTLWFNAMAAKGIRLQVHYIPVHLQPYYRESFGYEPGDFPAAENYYKHAVSLPIYPSLTDEDVEDIALTIKESLGIKPFKP